MKRRKFIKSGAIWIPSIFVPKLIRAQDLRSAQMKYQAWVKAHQASSGPNTWYDIDVLGNGNSDQFSNGGAASIDWWENVTVSQSGTATQLRVYIHQPVNGAGVKLAIYNSAGTTLLGSGTGASTGSAGYVTITMTSFSIASGTYIIACVSNNSSIGFYYNSGGAGSIFNGVGTYAAFPPASLPTGVGPFSRNMIAGVFVQ